jgi:hypothetical protein
MKIIERDGIKGHIHKNGGGFIAETAHVGETVFVDKNARVYGNAQVYGDARVYGNAQVYIKNLQESLLHTTDGLYIRLAKWLTKENKSPQWGSNTALLYEQGTVILPDSVDDNAWNLCTHGLHVFPLGYDPKWQGYVTDGLECVEVWCKPENIVAGGFPWDYGKIRCSELYRPTEAELKANHLITSNRDSKGRFVRVSK